MNNKKSKYQRFLLNNGLEVILVKRPELYTAALSGYFEAGSAYESKNNSGASHFVEHLLFRGNKKFPTVEAMDKEQESLGLGHGAYTSYDRIQYHASFPPAEIKSALEFTASCLFESLMAKAEIEKERQVMIEEEKLREDNLGIRTWDLALQTRLKEKGHPLTMPREGLLKSIRQLKPKTLRTYYQKYFQPVNLVLVIGSSLEFGKIQAITENIFVKFPTGQKVSRLKFDQDDFSSFTVAVEKREVEKAYLYFTFPAFSYNRSLKDRLAINLLSRILRRIRLDKRLYQEKGLSYDWSCGWSVPTHPLGLFWIYSSCDPKNLTAIIEIFFEELKKIKAAGVTAHELERQRSYLNKVQSMDFDSLTGAIDWFLDDFFDRQQFDPPEKLILVRNSLTTSHLTKISREVFDFKRLNVVVLGPTTQKQIRQVVQKELARL